MENSKSGIMAAEKRVEEMNRLAQGFLEQGNRYMQQKRGQPSEPRNMPRNTPRQPSPQQPSPKPPRFEAVGNARAEQPSPQKRNEAAPCSAPDPAQSGLSGRSSDTALIIMLAAVLISENADIKLILALLYILM